MNTRNQSLEKAVSGSKPVRLDCTDCSQECIDQIFSDHKIGQTDFESRAYRTGSTINAPKTIAVACIQQAVNNLADPCKNYEFMCYDESGNELATNEHIVVGYQNKMADVHSRFPIEVLIAISQRGDVDGVVAFYNGKGAKKEILIVFADNAGTTHYVDLSGDFNPNSTFNEISC